MPGCAKLVIAAALAGATGGAQAAITQLQFSGSGHIVSADNGLGIGDPATVSGSIHFPNGSDPDGPPAVANGFTGTIVLDGNALADKTEAFNFQVASSHHGLGVNTLTSFYAYMSGQATLVGGKLTGLYLSVDGDPDVSTLGTTTFGYDFEGQSFGGNWRLSLASDTPEPAAWALMLTGFGVVGAAARRARAVATA
jgi:hypothetical protein